MPVVTTLSGRSVEIPAGYELVPTESNLLTLVSRANPRGNLTIGLELGAPHRHPEPFDRPAGLPAALDTSIVEVERQTLGMRAPSRYATRPSAAEFGVLPTQTAEEFRVEAERRRRGLPPLPAPPQAPPPPRANIARTQVEHLGPRNLRIAVLPGEIVEAVRTLALDLGNLAPRTVVPIIAYGIWSARLSGPGNRVQPVVVLRPPSRLPSGPPYPVPAAQQAPVSYRTISAVMFAIYRGVPPRRTILDALAAAGWHSYTERLPSTGEAEYIPPETPQAATSSTAFVPERTPAFVPERIVRGQARFG